MTFLKWFLSSPRRAGGSSKGDWSPFEAAPPEAGKSVSAETLAALSGCGLPPGIWVQGFCPQLGGVGPCPAQCIWQGSGFAADQTNAMLATSNGGDKSSRKRKSLRLLGTAGFVEGFAIYSRETRCFFCWLSRDFFSLHTALFRHSCVGVSLPLACASCRRNAGRAGDTVA